MAATAPPRPVLDQVQNLLLASREKVFNSVTLAGSAFAFVALAANGFSSLPSGRAGMFALFVALFLILLTITFVRRLPFWLRAGTLLGLTYVLGAADVFASGIASVDGRTALLAVSVLTTILYGVRAGVGMGALSLATWVAAGVLFSFAGLHPAAPRDSAIFLDWLDGAANLLLFLVALNLPYREFLEVQMLASITAAQKKELQDAQATLETQTRKLAHTSEELTDANRRLQEQSRALERRATQLAVSAGVARIAASLHDLQELLDTTVILISERFGFYHAGIFLVDDAREWAVLKAANSAGGKRMLARGHRLRVGQQGIVGYVTETGRPRIALDVGADAVHFLNPDLPDTHSEMAVPLMAQGEVIGALDVQSTEVNAFSQEDVEVLQTLADQLAVAIDNARRFEETHRRLEELRALQAGPLSAAQTGRAERPLAFRYDGVTISPAEPQPEQSRPPVEGPDHIQIPISAGDNTLGTLELARLDENWTDDDVELGRIIADRMALALENARLYETTRQSLAETDRLYRATRALGAAQSLDDVLRAVMIHAVAPFMGRFVVGLVELGPDRAVTELRVVAVWDAATASADYSPGPRLSVGDLPFLRLLDPGYPILIESLDVPELDEQSRAFFRAQDTGALAAIPVTAGSSLIGVFIVQTREPHAFSLEEVRPLQALADRAATAIENLRLLEETQQRIAELVTLNSISQALASQVDIYALLAQVGDKITQTFGAKIAYIALYNKHTGLIEFPYSIEDGVLANDPPLPLGRGLSSHVILNRQPLVLNQNAEQRAVELGARFIGEAPQSYVGVPILAGDEAIGLISLQSMDQEGLYDEATVRLLSTIAANLGIALQNAQLFEETRRRVAELATLNSISQIVTSQQELNVMLWQVGQKILEIFGSPNGFIALYDQRTNLIEVPYFVEKGEAISAGPFPLGQGLSSIIIRDRRPLLINRDTEQKARELGAIFVGDPARSFLGVPVLAGEEVIGVINVQSTEHEGLWNEDDVRLLSTIAASVGGAIQNARLLDETQRRAEQLAAAAEVSRASTSVLDPDELIVQTVELIRDRFDLYYAAIFLADASGEWAMLRHATGEAGQELLRRGHRLEVGGQSMVGWAVANRKPRIALDVGQEAVRFANPLLPDTRSEMALPLAVGDAVLGALDVQSTRAGAFSDADIRALQTMADQIAIAIRNAQLLRDIRQRAQQLATAADVSRASISVLNPDELIVQTVELIRNRFDLYYAAIFLADASGEWAMLRHATGEAGQELLRRGHRLEVGGQSMVGWAVANRKPRIALDVGQEAVRFANPLLPDTRSEMALPLAVGDAVLGALDVQSTQANAFSEADITALQTMADQVAIAIQNARLFKDVHEERETLTLLYDVLRALSGSLELTTTINTALQFAPRLGAQHAYILVLGETEEEVLFRATVPGLDHFNAREAREFGQAIAQTGLERWVLENRRPAVVADTRLDERWYTAPSHEEIEPARSVISAPLRTQRGLAGVLAYTHSIPGALAEAQLPLIESIAGQVAVAIENARLFEQRRIQQFNAAALARATQAMSRTLSEAELQHILVDELFAVYRPRGVVFYRWDALEDTLTPVVVRVHPEETEPWPMAGESIGGGARPELLLTLLSHQGAIRPMQEESDFQIRESMTMPLLSGGQVEAVVEVIHSGPLPGLAQSDLELFKEIMGAAAGALQTIRLYELQRSTAERLAEVDKLKSQFLANMSHELRTPLNSIIGFSRVILKGIDGPLTDLQTQDLNSIYNAGQHLLGLINDILDMSRIEAGKMELVFDEVDLRDIFKGVLSTTTALIKDKPITLREEIAPDLPAVRADSMRVRQVLLNLLANAAKFTEKGSITLHARAVEALNPRTDGLEPYVEISVRDTGQGIPSKDMPKLFEAFSMVDASPTRKTGGTGLGLSICRSLVELHGGRIWAESEGIPGEGSTFTFSLPVFRAEPPAPPEPTPEEMKGAPAILVVDDDQGIVRLYRRYLEPHGYRVVGVSKALEVIPAAVEYRPVAILLDVLMPNQDGWSVLEDLKREEATRSIPVIMCTIATDRARAFEMGAAEYLIKPILEADLLRAFEKLRINGRAKPPERALAALARRP
jgi:GAF domain-containing protein/CheY-like chemotaxis protein